jgi:hypothetical protein
MTIRVYQPALSVTLTRLVNRTQTASGSYASPFQTVDLTPYLGTAGSVTTMKDIDQPTGAFSVTFADKIHSEFGDTVYALCEPMDMIEIRMAREPQNYQASGLPLVMRGFVTTVGRREAMSSDGTPTRTVQIIGQDSGKLLDLYRVLFEFMVATGDQSYIETFKLQAMIGMAAENVPVATFMTQLITDVVNPRIGRLIQFTGEYVKPFQVDTVDGSVPGMVSANLAASIDSVSVWQLMDMFADRPWNELFVHDEEDGPHLVFRQAPYKDYTTGGYVLNGATDPGTVNLDISDVVEMNVQRSDTRVANFFWVPAGVMQLDSSMAINAMALVTGWPGIDLNHDANSPIIFGQRKMQVETKLYNGSQNQVIALVPASAQQQSASRIVSWVQARSAQLLAMNRDNSLFEEGSAVVKGSEDILPGLYLQLTRGALMSEAYIKSVTQTFAPLSSWTTQVQLIRGTGFKVRSDYPGAPYVAEGFRGPYSR